jgi:hypothetical protein
MNRIRYAIALLLAAALLISTGCLELVGQRVTIKHDAAKDELHVLIHYDGIHDSGNNQYGDGAAQVAEAVQNGEFMLFGWPFHIKPKEMKEKFDAEAGNEPPAVRAFGKALFESLEVKSIGFHRDPDGRIGGSQLVTIKNAKAFIKAANGAISATILNPNNGAPPAEFVRSIELIKAAAGKDHQWLALDGNAIKVSLPIHPREWAALKAKGLVEIVKEIRNMASADNANKEQDEKNTLRAIALLTSLPLSYSDTGGMLTVRIGETETPSTIRFENDQAYKANIVDAVEKAAGTDTDAVMAKLMLGEKVEKSELVGEVMQWGPAEEKVRGLMKACRANDAKIAGAAVKRLEAFAEAWNKNEGFPSAPAPNADTEKYLAAWSVWYVNMLRFPVAQ